jgi:hypothetical protein
VDLSNLGRFIEVNVETPIQSRFSLLRRSSVLLAVVAVIYLLTVFLNDGFLATDEYFTGITRYIPAQSSDIHHLVRPDDVKSVLQILPMHMMAQLALKVGIESPYGQYRFVLAALSLIHFLLLAFVFTLYYRREKLVGTASSGGAGKDDASPEKNQWLLICLFGFFFMAPFAFTRPMFESLAAPWIALAVYFGSLYEQNHRRRDLFLSVLFVSVAFVLRQQVGICALAILILTLLEKRWKDFVFASSWGLVFFILAGIPDYFLRGAFHFSLRAVLTYNIAHGAEYANHPIYTYPVLIFGLCFGPWWLRRYPQGFWQQHWSQHRMAWVVLGLFVFGHSLFPQKWERFIISMVPVMMILMVPLMALLLREYPGRRWRLWSMLGLNGLLWLVSSFFPPQKNLINLSLYLDKHPEVRVVYRVDNIPEWITDAFIRQPNFEFRELTNKQLAELAGSGDCSEILVVPEFLKDKVNAQTWFYDETMRVNAVEALAYRMNPKSNVRRTGLAVYRGCSH